MNRTELKDLCFADELAILTTPLRTLLFNALNGLRDDLFSLPESAGNSIKLRLFKKCVVSINRLSQNLDIDTADRDDLCELLFKVARFGKVELSSKFVDELRDW